MRARHQLLRPRPGIWSACCRVGGGAGLCHTPCPTNGPNGGTFSRVFGPCGRAHVLRPSAVVSEFTETPGGVRVARGNEQAVSRAATIKKFSLLDEDFSCAMMGCAGHQVTNLSYWRHSTTGGKQGYLTIGPATGGRSGNEVNFSVTYCRPPNPTPEHLGCYRSELALQRDVQAKALEVKVLQDRMRETAKAGAASLRECRAQAQAAIKAIEAHARQDFRGAFLHFGAESGGTDPHRTLDSSDQISAPL